MLLTKIIQGNRITSEFGERMFPPEVELSVGNRAQSLGLECIMASCGGLPKRWRMGRQ